MLSSVFIRVQYNISTKVNHNTEFNSYQLNQNILLCHQAKELKLSQNINISATQTILLFMSQTENIHHPWQCIYIYRMHPEKCGTFRVLLRFVAVGRCSIYPHHSGLLQWHRGKRKIVPVPLKQRRGIWVNGYHINHLNSLWPTDAIWRHRSGSTLAQVMACCLTAPSHYLNQCWLIIS